jgi:branched-chain amino acid transport system substrate-binding protein
MPYGNLAIDEGTAKTMGDTAVGMYMSASYLTSIDTPQNRKFLDALKAKFGNDAKTANEFSAPQYEAFYLYKAAVEKAGGTDAPKVVQALSAVTFDGPRGPVTMDRQRHAALTMRLGQVQQDGSIKILQTFDKVDPGAQCPDLK